MLKPDERRQTKKLLGAPGIATNGARTLLGAPGLTTRNKKLLGAKGKQQNTIYSCGALQCCPQVDHGFGAGDSGLRVYVAGAADVKPRQIQAMPVSWLMSS